MIPAWKWGKTEKHEKLELTPEEEGLQEKIRSIWSGILSGQVIEEHTDFFKSGAGSMDVTRLLEEVRELTGVEMENDDAYMNSTFSEFVKQLVLMSRGGEMTELEYDAVSTWLHALNVVYFGLICKYSLLPLSPLSPFLPLPSLFLSIFSCFSLTLSPLSPPLFLSLTLPPSIPPYLPSFLSPSQAVIRANNLEIRCPHQCFINNEFVDASDGKTYQTINPTDESAICELAASGAEDVEKAIKAAKVNTSVLEWLYTVLNGRMSCYQIKLCLTSIAIANTCTCTCTCNYHTRDNLQHAFEKGPWKTMNARDRGKLIHR